MAQGSVKPLEVVWLRKALLNLDEEATYIAQDNPQAAQQVVTRIVHAIGCWDTAPGWDDRGGCLGPANCRSPRRVT